MPVMTKIKVAQFVDDSKSWSALCTTGRHQ